MYFFIKFNKSLGANFLHLYSNLSGILGFSKDKEAISMVLINTIDKGSDADYKTRGIGIDAAIFRKRYLTRNGHNFFIRKIAETDLPILKDYVYQTCSYSDIEQGIKCNTQAWLGVFNDKRQLSSLMGIYFTKQGLELISLETFNNFNCGLATALVDIATNWAINYHLSEISSYIAANETGRSFLTDMGFELTQNFLDFEQSQDLFEPVKVGELLNADDFDDIESMTSPIYKQKFAKKIDFIK